MSDRNARTPQSTPGLLVASSSRRSLLQHGAALGVGLAGLGAIEPTVHAATANPLGTANLGLQGELAAEQVIRLPEGEPVRFDPGVTHGGRGLEMLQNLFEGLVCIDQRDGSLQMGVAERWTSTTSRPSSPSRVRDGVTWSDGTPLNANDFEWSWKRVLDPETKSEYTTAIYPIKNARQRSTQGEWTLDDLGVKAIDERTLMVTLEGPTPISRYWPQPGPSTPCRGTSSKKGMRGSRPETWSPTVRSS